MNKVNILLIAITLSCSAFAQEEEQVCQNIYFNEGWNFISTYIDVGDDYAADYFYEPVVNNLLISKNNQGHVYLPEFGLLPHMFYNYEGYQAKFIQADTLVKCGIQIIPEEYPITLEQGWNIMPYLRDTPQDTEEALSSISSEIHLVKNILGQVYMPSWDYNGIGDLEPGKGYQIKMNSEQTLIYDAND
jgi:hypothetical protein